MGVGSWDQANYHNLIIYDFPVTKLLLCINDPVAQYTLTDLKYSLQSRGGEHPALHFRGERIRDVMEGTSLLSPSLVLLHTRPRPPVCDCRHAPGDLHIHTITFPLWVSDSEAGFFGRYMQKTTSIRMHIQIQTLSFQVTILARARYT